MCINNNECKKDETNCCDLCMYVLNWVGIVIENKQQICLFTNFFYCSLFSSFSRYEQTLELPHLPEMVFNKNVLTIKHKSGAKIEFNALDALKHVKNCRANLQVACANEWKESRPEIQTLEEVKQYDWSFATDYQGTFNKSIRCEDTEEKIDIFKLMKKEKILFYHDLTLFEDELHDHGIATCSVKIVSANHIFSKVYFH